MSRRSAQSMAWALSVTSLVFFSASASGAGCASTSKDDTFESAEGGLGFFSGPDAGDVNAEDGSGKIPLLCAVNECPADRVTCPESLYLCQVDLLTDHDNCGTCGYECPSGAHEGAEFTCVGGSCIINCTSIDGAKVLDCNGDSGDGCEVSVRDCDQAHCGSCAACPSGIDCVYGASGPRCGCETGLTQCGSGCDAKCTDTRNDDAHCRVCDNECDFTLGKPIGTCTSLPPQSYYGCAESECGNRKCNPKWDDCDKDLYHCPSNGCETLVDNDPNNCGQCGHKCLPESKCVAGRCEKPPCKAPKVICNERCTDLGTDSDNCGTCDHFCRKDTACVRGKCVLRCPLGFGDCDGFAPNGCETDLLHDPEHCGECGNACDLAAGQPCIEGLCLRGPCGPGQTR